MPMANIIFPSCQAEDAVRVGQAASSSLCRGLTAKGRMRDSCRRLHQRNGYGYPGLLASSVTKLEQPHGYGQWMESNKSSLFGFLNTFLCLALDFCSSGRTFNANTFQGEQPHFGDLSMASWNPASTFGTEMFFLRARCVQVCIFRILVLI